MKKIAKPICLVLALLMTMVVMFTGCASESSESQSAETEQASTTTEATSEGSESAETATYKFAVVGPGVHNFYAKFPDAIADVAEQYGLGDVDLEFPQEFNQDEQNSIIDTLVARGYNGIAIQPSDSVAANAKITEVMDMGIYMTGFGAAPEEPTDLPFCVATDVYTSAYSAAETLCELLNGEGTIVHLTGNVADANTQSRMQAIDDVAAEYPGITVMQHITDIDDTETAQNAVNNLMGASRDEIDGIVCTAYNPTVACASTFTQMNITDIVCVGIDTDDAVLEAIRDGYITGTMSQNPYAMAYLSVLGLKYYADGYTYTGPFNVDSGTFLITQDNVDDVDSLLAETTATLLEQFDSYWTS